MDLQHLVDCLELDNELALDEQVQPVRAEDDPCTLLVASLVVRSESHAVEARGRVPPHRLLRESRVPSACAPRSPHRSRHPNIG